MFSTLFSARSENSSYLIFFARSKCIFVLDPVSCECTPTFTHISNCVFGKGWKKSQLLRAINFRAAFPRKLSGAESGKCTRPHFHSLSLADRTNPRPHLTLSLWKDDALTMPSYFPIWNINKLVNSFHLLMLPHMIYSYYGAALLVVFPVRERFVFVTWRGSWKNPKSEPRPLFVNDFGNIWPHLCGSIDCCL